MKMVLLLDTKYKTIVVEVITGVAFQSEAITRTEICRDVVNPLRLMFWSYGNRSVDLQFKSNDWFLYDENIRFESVSHPL